VCLCGRTEHSKIIRTQEAIQMMTLRLVATFTSGVALTIYVGTVTFTVLTGLHAADGAKRRNARQVLALLLRTPQGRRRTET
jgi:hypothetical protein